MAKTYEGSIMLNDIKAHITAREDSKPNSILKSWSGEGYADTVQVFEPASFETVIGTIVVNRVHFDGGKVRFTFEGSGPPKF